MDIPIERLKRWCNLCSQRKPLIFSCVVFHVSWLVSFYELIPVNSVATNTNHQCHPNHTDHIKVLTLLRQLLQTHTEFKKKHNAHEHKTAVTAQLSNAMEHRTGLKMHSCGCFWPGQQLCEQSDQKRVPYSFAVKLGWKTINEQEQLRAVLHLEGQEMTVH